MAAEHDDEGRDEGVERLYELAKSGRWVTVLAALAGEPELAASCSRHVKPSSGWTFLHQAAHAGLEDAVRALVRLGASTTARSRDEQAPAEVAAKAGHPELARLLEEAARTAGGLWKAPADPACLPSSSAFSEAVRRRARRDRRVAYGGGIVSIPRGGHYFADAFERTLVGWHGTYDPPCDMDGEPMITR